MKPPFKWSYGVTTVPSRFDDLLPRTLNSLEAAGFGNPRLFVDGCNDINKVPQPLASRPRDVTRHFPKVGLVANWMSALWVLYATEPNADRYAIFQDDFVTYLNLREYLERSEYPECSYLNLYTTSYKQEKCPKDYVGWFPSNQKGRGAVALVFNREAVTTIFQARHMAMKPQGAKNGDKTIDGAIIDSMTPAGYTEQIHSPSLVQHTGRVSTLQNVKYTKSPAQGFRGENFDALELLK